MEKKEKGKFYKDTTLQSKNWRMMIWTAPFTYITGMEMPLWMLMLRRADWTTFEDGTFCISHADVMLELGVSESTVIRAMKSLFLMGFYSKDPAGALGLKITINYDGLSKLCSIIQKNPGIGPYLRMSRGKDQNINFIKDLDVEAAKKLMEEMKNQMFAEKEPK